MRFQTPTIKHTGFCVNVLVIVLTGMLTTTVSAQVPFDECGVFVADPAGSCPLFSPYALPGNYLVDLGTLPIPPPGTEARITGTQEDCAATCFPTACVFGVTIDLSCGGSAPQPEFIRGDCNNDTTFNIADVIFHLFGLFAAGPPPECQNACDFNGDQVIDISDAVVMLTLLFQGGGPPPPPWPDCGVDPAPPAWPDCLNPSCP